MERCDPDKCAVRVLIAMASPLITLPDTTCDGTSTTLGDPFNRTAWILLKGGLLAHPGTCATLGAGLRDNRLLTYEPDSAGRAIPNAVSATDALFKVDLHVRLFLTDTLNNRHRLLY
jgi:hypothetical protein